MTSNVCMYGSFYQHHWIGGNEMCFIIFFFSLKKKEFLSQLKRVKKGLHNVVLKINVVSCGGTSGHSAKNCVSTNDT